MSSNNIKKWIMDSVKANGRLIIGGLGMITLGVICKKLNIPYQVLTNPVYTQKHDASDPSQIVYISNDPIVTSIGAIYISAKDMVFDSSKYDAAKEIVSILSANKKLGKLSDYATSYAITVLQAIGNEMTFSSSKNDINKLISEIAKGEF